jgi:hypothetical protein
MLGLLTAALGLAACATLRPPTPTAVAPADPEAVWGRVLAEHVDSDGAIDFVGLRERPRDLEAYVAWVAGHGPRSTPALFPTRESRLAYYINAYNALAMYQVVATPRRPEEQVRFFVASRVPIDGRTMSLYALENDVIRPLGEPRVHFALNCMGRGCPRLPRAPFTAERLDTMLDAETRRFLDDPRNVQVDPPLRTVRLNSTLRFYTADFLAAAPSLPAYVNRYRSAPIPEDYRVRFIPYDWTLHQR